MIAAAEELSVKSVVVAGTFIFSSSSRCRSHVISQVVYARARYSASVDDLAILCYFLVCHEIRFSLRNMANPVVDLRVVGQAAQSEYEKALIQEVCDTDEKKSPRPGELFMYLSTLLTFLVSSFVGLAIC